MKGIVFTEFMQMVEEQFGVVIADHLIESTRPASGGAYTLVGNYPSSEMHAMVAELSRSTGIKTRELLRAYGRYLFPRLANKYPGILQHVADPFDMIVHLEEIVHVEVKKLYADARPPMFKGRWIGDNEIEVIYHSSRSMGDVAVGLIEGCADHYGQTFQVMATPLNEEGTVVQINITR